MPGTRKGSGSEGRRSNDGSSASHPHPPHGPYCSSHPAGGSPSNTSESNYTEAACKRADLGTVKKHGRHKTTSNHSASPRSGGIGTNKMGTGTPPRFVPAERRTQAENLRRLLYPHPDELADFKSSVGGDFKLYRQDSYPIIQPVTKLRYRKRVRFCPLPALWKGVTRVVFRPIMSFLTGSRYSCLF